jgi:hypothetical protein
MKEAYYPEFEGHVLLHEEFNEKNKNYGTGYLRIW